MSQGVSAMPTRGGVFFDRDGVLTELVFNPATGEDESPHALADLRLCAGARDALRAVQAAGFALFLVSNQPSYAKGKVGLEVIQAIAAAVEQQCADAGVVFRETFYCFHHPQGIVPEYSGACACRKPSPYFLHQAAARHGIDLGRSWMVGDRDSDIASGQAAGCRTILVREPKSRQHQGNSTPEYAAADVAAAAAIIRAQGDTGACKQPGVAPAGAKR